MFGRFNFLRFVKKNHLLIKLFLLGLLTMVILMIVKPSKLIFDHNLKTLRVGFNDWVGSSVVLYGVEKDLFAKRGLKIDLFSFDNLQDAGRAMIRGSLDLTFTTLWDLMQTDPGKDSPTVLMVVDVSHGADGLVTQPEIKSVHELINKKVAAKLGTINHLILLEALNLYEIEPHQVKIVDVSNEAGAAKMYNKTVEGAVAWQPLLGQIAKKVNGNITYTTRDQDSIVIDVLASRSEFVSEHSLEITQFVLAWFDIMYEIETKPEQLFKVLSEQLGSSEGVLAQNYQQLKKGDIQLNQEMFAPNGKLNQAKAKIRQFLRQDLRHNRVIREDVTLETELLMGAVKAWKKPPHIRQ